MSEPGLQLLFLLANVSYFVVLDKVESHPLPLDVLIALNCLRIL